MMVNGKELADVLSALRQYKAPTETKDMGKKSFDYYKIEEFVQIFDETVGVNNYTVEFSDLQHLANNGGQDMIGVKCRITIYDDEGKALTYREGYGAQELFYSADNSGRDVNFAGDIHSATTAAFKNAARWFGVFGLYTKERKTPEKKPTPKQPKKDVVYNFYTTGEFFETGEDKDRKVWKVAAKRDSSKSDINCEIIFYPNQYKKDVEKFNRLFATVAQKATRLKLKVKECGEREHILQYVFTDYA